METKDILVFFSLYFINARMARKCIQNCISILKGFSLLFFHSDMFSVIVLLIKNLFKIFATLSFSDIEHFFTINVIFWLYCEPFSVKKGLQSFHKFLFFIL